MQTSIEGNELIVKQVELFKTKVDELEGKEVSEETLSHRKVVQCIC